MRWMIGVGDKAYALGNRSRIVGPWVWGELAASGEELDKAGETCLSPLEIESVEEAINELDKAGKVCGCQ